MKVFLDLAHGDAEAHRTQSSHHEKLCEWLKANASTYGLSSDLAKLDEAGRETVAELFKVDHPHTPCLMNPPESIILGRLVFRLSDAANLAKQVENFRYLITGESAPGKNKKGLGYKGTPIHRFVKGFVIQGGDVTRKDGSGGESIYGGTLTDPKPPHLKHSFGSLSYASGSSRNSSTSQFFICLGEAGSTAVTKKLDGKYFPFGELVKDEGGGKVGPNGGQVLQYITGPSDVATETGLAWDQKKEATLEKLWIEDCGIVEE